MSDAEHIAALVTALADAKRHIERLESTGHQLLCEVASLRAKAKSDREIRVLEEYKDTAAQRAVRAACKTLKIDPEAILQRGEGGQLSRQPHLIADRMRLVVYLRRKTATPLGPMSYPDIARGMGIPSHSTIISMERRAGMRAMGRALPLVRAGEYG